MPAYRNSNATRATSVERHTPFWYHARSPSPGSSVDIDVSTPNDDLSERSIDSEGLRDGGASPQRGRSGSVNSRKRTRQLLTEEQSRVLHELLEITMFPDTPTRHRVAKSLGLSPRKVQVFFQNKRQKQRRLTVSGEPAPDLGPGPNFPIAKRRTTTSDSLLTERNLATMLNLTDGGEASSSSSSSMPKPVAPPTPPDTASLPSPQDENRASSSSMTRSISLGWIKEGAAVEAPASSHALQRQTSQPGPMLAPPSSTDRISSTTVTRPRNGSSTALPSQSLLLPFQMSIILAPVRPRSPSNVTSPIGSFPYDTPSTHLHRRREPSSILTQLRARSASASAGSISTRPPSTLRTLTSGTNGHSLDASSSSTSDAHALGTSWDQRYVRRSQLRSNLDIASRDAPLAAPAPGDTVSTVIEARQPLMPRQPPTAFVAPPPPRRQTHCTPLPPSSCDSSYEYEVPETPPRNRHPSSVLRLPSISELRIQ